MTKYDDSSNTPNMNPSASDRYAFNPNSIESIADTIIDYLDTEGVILRDPLSQTDPEGLDDGVYSVNPAAIDTIATTMLAIFADVIAGILDAGSERDAVNESKGVYEAFRTELTTWTKGI